MRSRKHLLTLLLCLFVQGLLAQELSVKSFRLLENDLTANTHATMVKDKNGEVAALIKVVTTEQGFAFDGGMTGIVLIKQGTGEVWVYVPHGIKRINIQHQQFGVLRDYYFPIPIEKARTYELVLTTPKIETAVEQKPVENYNNVRANFFVLRTNEPKASIYVDGYPYQSRNDGSIQGMLPYGEHTYQVKLRGHETAEGTFTIDDETVDFQIPKLTKYRIPRWYIQGGIGRQGKFYEYYATPCIASQIGIGYNFNEVVGTRLTVNGWESSNYEHDSSWYTSYSWNYISPVVDFSVSLSNLLLGYKPNRIVNLGIFAGVGANIAFNNYEIVELLNQNPNDWRYENYTPWEGTKTFFTNRVGMHIDFRMSKNWSASIEHQTNFIYGDYDSYYNFSSYVSHLVSLKYTFGRRQNK